MKLYLFILISFYTLTNSFILLRNPFHKCFIYKKTQCNLSYLDNINNYNNSLNQSNILYPIPTISFDEFFLNLNGITKLYMTQNKDRLIIDYKNKRGMYYIKNQERSKVDYLLTQISVPINIIINIASLFDDLNGPLFFSEEEKINKTIDDYIYKYYNDTNETNILLEE